MNKAKWIEYLMQGLIFILLVGSVAQSIFVSLYLPVPYWHTLAITLCAFFVLSLWLKNRWTFLLSLLAVFLLGWTVSSLFLPDKWWLELLPWLEWLIYYPIGLALLEESFLYPSVWLVIFLLSILFYLLAVKFRLFIPALIIGISAFAIEWMLGHTTVIPYVWPFAIAAVSLFSGSHYHQLSKGNSLPAYGIWQLAAFPLVAAVVLTAFILTPDDTGRLKWKAFEERITDLQEDFSDWFGFSKPRKPFRLSDTGFPSDSNQLGGPVQLSNDVVMEVISPVPLYLRGSILNHYTGSGWTNSILDKRYKFQDSQWRGILNTAFDLDEPIWSSLTEEEKDNFFSSFPISITHTGIETSALFNVLQSTDMASEKPRAFVPYFNGRGETFTTRNINREEPYTMNVRIPNLYLEELQEYIIKNTLSIDWSSPIPEDLLGDPLYGQKLLNIQKYYTEIPKGIPQRVIDLAREITENAQSPFEKAVALQKYLQENYSYTLTPPYTPEDRDFVDYFLFDLKEGYCTYFATSMAVMGRAAGLPTRYIEGFCMPIHFDPGNKYRVQKSNGHAWVEVYFPNIGWITFDPTPYSAFRESPGAGTYMEGPVPNWQEYMNLYDIQWEDWDPEKYKSKIQRPLPWHQRLLTAARVPFLIILLLGLSAAGIFLWYKLRWIPVNRQEPQAQLRTYYREILWLFTLYKFPIRRGETPYTYAERIDRWLVNEWGSMMDISRLLVESEFGSYQLTSDDMEKVRGFHRDLEKNLSRVMSFPRYLLILISRHVKQKLQKKKRPALS